MSKRRRRHAGPSAALTRTKRWKALRLEALRRDGFACVKCGDRARLEVDHIQPVRDAPPLAYVLDNLQTLCSSCHGRKTRDEVGLPPMNPKRREWLDLIKNM